MIVETKNLEIGYAQTTLLSHISITVESPQLILLLGLNGIGKSTLLRSLAGLVAPLSGTILVKNQNIHQLSAQSRAALVTGVFTGRDYDAYITVRELVLLGRYRFSSSMGRLSTDDENMVESILHESGIADIADHRVSQISDGERQQAFIAKALLQDTPLLLLDEPTAFLDYKNKHRLLSMLHDICVTNARTIILSTHDIEAALPFTHRLLMLTANRQLIDTSAPLTMHEIASGLG